MDFLPTFDSYALVFTTGAAGMGTSIVLMYLYQATFGSIFLHVGLISTLFMFGLAIGSAVATRHTTDPMAGSSRLLQVAMLIQALLCAAILLTVGRLTHSGFAAAFVVSGLVNGIYVPLAVRRLHAAGVLPPSAGAWIEALDSLGGAAGGMVAGLVLLPLFGASYALVMLALLPLINVAAAFPQASQRGRLPCQPQSDSCKPMIPSLLCDHGGAEHSRDWIRPAGYVLFGITVFVLVAGLLLRRGGTEDMKIAFLEFARSASGRNELRAKKAVLPDGKTLDYFITTNPTPVAASAGERYVFATDTFAPDIVGYGGSITLAVVIEADGTLRDVTVLRSDETPAYLDYLKSWLQSLLGKNLFAHDPVRDVDAVTGATLTSSAIIRILRKAGPDFAGSVLGRKIDPALPEIIPTPPLSETVWLVTALAAALALRAWPSRWLRRGFLVLVVVLSGFVFNSQYSLAHVFSLLGLTIPPFGRGMAFLLVIGVPVLVAMFGNIYCGYLCPFGALQELTGDLRPASVRTDVDKNTWAYGRLVKYLLLGVITLMFATTFAPAMATCDPLVTIFAHGRSYLLPFRAVLLVGLAFFYPRFWCRNLCPTGAFLSLLNGIRLLKRLSPAVNPRACIYGVTERSDLDCLCCDRCRRPGRLEREALARPSGCSAARPGSALMLAAVAVLATALAIQAAAIRRAEITGAGARGRVDTIGRGARPVDMKLLRRLIEQDKLSGHEASFYKAATDGPSQP